MSGGVRRRVPTLVSGGHLGTITTDVFAWSIVTVSVFVIVCGLHSLGRATKKKKKKKEKS